MSKQFSLQQKFPFTFVLQPMSQMPRSHNPYLDREHCLLCRRERPDPPANRIPPGVGGSEKENNRQLPITQVGSWEGWREGWREEWSGKFQTY